MFDAVKSHQKKVSTLKIMGFGGAANKMNYAGIDGFSG
jgi:hypothetical protein